MCTRVLSHTSEKFSCSQSCIHLTHTHPSHSPLTLTPHTRPSAVLSLSNIESKNEDLARYWGRGVRVRDEWVGVRVRGGMGVRDEGEERDAYSD